jgi:beta-phosphoglucomutase-like phosphatase (HAD superfamily)
LTVASPRIGSAVRVLLCDADGCLFPSEEPAFEASARVTNGFLAEIGVDSRFSGEQLRLATTGRNFRNTATALALEAGRRVQAATLERWVETEKREVTAHLARVLGGDPEVQEPLDRLGRRLSLAVVSSSAAARVDACLEATGLDRLFPREQRFSAEDSLPAPASKPDPAIYLFALAELGISATEGLAVEDSVPGAEAALAAGVPTVGNLAFVPEAERRDRRAALECVGVTEVIHSWRDLC